MWQESWTNVLTCCAPALHVWQILDTEGPGTLNALLCKPPFLTNEQIIPGQSAGILTWSRGAVSYSNGHYFWAIVARCQVQINTLVESD